LQVLSKDVDIDETCVGAPVFEGGETVTACRQEVVGPSPSHFEVGFATNWTFQASPGALRHCLLKAGAALPPKPFLNLPYFFSVSAKLL
jgi:hypothetical protein